LNSIFHPKAYFKSIYEITPKYLKNKGILCVLLDIDNTLVPYSVKTPDMKVLNWMLSLKREGIKLAILSNAEKERAENFSKGIAEEIANELNLITIGKAGKPLGKGFKRAAKELATPKEKMCIIGDQIFTDILGGNLNKVFSIQVTPIDRNESLFIRSKRVFEKPINSSYKRRYKNKGGYIVGLLGVIGSPINHSVSPELHNAICEVTGYNFYYDKFEIKPEQLEESMNSFCKSGFKGLNVTVPHKEKVMQYLDIIDDEAKKVGAVNTVVFDGEKILGYNTDIDGFVNALYAGAGQEFTLKGRQVLILGAGGSARAVAAGCLKNGVSRVDFLNRTHVKAKDLAEMFFKEYRADTGVLTTEDEAFADKFREYDLIVNTTSAGMKPQENVMPIPQNMDFEFTGEQVYFDLIYNPSKTLMMKKAEADGAVAINGKDMLFYQGIKSFNIWAEANGCKSLTKEEEEIVRGNFSKRREVTYG